MGLFWLFLLLKLAGPFPERSLGMDADNPPASTGRELQSCSERPRELKAALLLPGKPCSPCQTQPAGHCSKHWWHRGMAETAAKDQTPLSSSPCTARALVMGASTCCPLGLLLSSHSSISASSKVCISQRCHECNTAERQRQQFLKMFPALVHQKMLYPIFQELLNSAHLLSRVSFGSGDKSSNIPIVSDEGICQNLCRPCLDRFAALQ